MTERAEIQAGGRFGTQVDRGVARAACPAVFIAAPASGQGKTTVTAALARMLRNQGKVVRVFKTGPDYLDPLVLAQASGQPVDQLDLWMAGEAYCRQRLFDAALEADLILVEGAMGLFDGEPSSADLAALFDLPMVIVMDVKGMAQTAAALVAGLAGFRDDIRIAGLIANACGSPRHRELIEAALPPDIPLLAAVERNANLALPERHLGLVQAEEIREDLETRFETGAKALLAEGLAEALLQLPPVTFAAVQAGATEALPSLHGQTIAVARDAAFSFIYQANLDLLERMGARLRFFSPLTDECLPPCDALWLPGGYPELHAAQLAANASMRDDIHRLFAADKPILAECGGMLYCLETLTDYDDQIHTMLGLLPGHGAMRGRRGCQGMQTADLPEGPIRGHAHHRSVSEGTPEPIAHGRRQRHPAPGEAIYRLRRLTASYLHLFFPDNPAAVASLFGQGTGHTIDTEESNGCN
ncbi:cobyrinic acid a,c-diamide synthase [Litchfieldella anticariensis FP35 = DSM 16096]|uniref:Cobyrinic acid a,c-diamide synthase n=1 Tax=Litchfieldella anticariensis (strain DSM 16096 / CECT 5854 / CIP 108499 / LMG 22089 / FP35) TaxID=1121939 RepID=S2LCF6_LITA3|nr:cobyrinate a,c-diamide synthase [Halomonas anticariensis]EPC02401.1 cobyrinic acid a,c-diamide synthase [Halomonas anticariensis FP35 = DSM 16096]